MTDTATTAPTNLAAIAARAAQPLDDFTSGLTVLVANGFSDGLTSAEMSWLLSELRLAIDAPATRHNPAQGLIDAVPFHTTRSQSVVEICRF